MKTAKNKLQNVTTKKKKRAKKNNPAKKKKIKLSCRSLEASCSLDVVVPTNDDFPF